MVLTDKQRNDLHSSIYEYLNTSGFTDVASSFAEQCNIPQTSIEKDDVQSSQTNSNQSSFSGVSLLEKKWLSVIRLQKKVLDLEGQVKRISLSPSSQQASSSSSSSSSSFSSSSSSTNRLLPIDEPPPKEMKGHKGSGINCLALHPFQTTVCSAGEDATLKLWDWENANFEMSLKGHTAGIQAVAFNGDGNLLVSCSSDLSIKLWDGDKNYLCFRTLRGHDHNVSQILFMPNLIDNSKEEHILSCSRDQTIKIWEISTGFCVHTFAGHDSWVRTIAVTSNGKLIASGGNDNNVVLYEVEGRKQGLTLRGHEHVIESVAFSPFAVGGSSGASGGSEPSSVSPPTSPNALFLLASASRDKTIRLWNSSTGEQIHVFTDHDNWVRSIAFHRSSKYILSVSDDRTLRIFDVKNRRCLKTFPNAGNHFVQSVAASLNMPVVVTAGVDNIVKVWNVR